MIIHSNLSEMKNKILPTCLQGNYRNSLGEFRNISNGAPRPMAERTYACSPEPALVQTAGGGWLHSLLLLNCDWLGSCLPPNVIDMR